MCPGILKYVGRYWSSFNFNFFLAQFHGLFLNLRRTYIFVQYFCINFYQYYLLIKSLWDEILRGNNGVKIRLWTSNMFREVLLWYSMTFVKCISDCSYQQRMTTLKDLISGSRLKKKTVLKVGLSLGFFTCAWNIYSSFLNTFELLWP